MKRINLLGTALLTIAVMTSCGRSKSAKPGTTNGAPTDSATGRRN